MRVIVYYGSGDEVKEVSNIREVEVDNLTTFYNYLSGEVKVFWDELSRGERNNLLRLLKYNYQSPVNQSLTLYIITNNPSQLPILKNLSSKIIWKGRRRQELWLKSKKPYEVYTLLHSLKLPPQSIFTILTHSNTKINIVRWLAEIDRYIGKISPRIAYILLTFIPSAVLGGKNKQRELEDIAKMLKEKYGFSRKEIKEILRFEELARWEIEEL